MPHGWIAHFRSSRRRRAADPLTDARHERCNSPNVQERSEQIALKARTKGEARATQPPAKIGGVAENKNGFEELIDAKTFLSLRTVAAGAQPERDVLPNFLTRSGSDRCRQYPAIGPLKRSKIRPLKTESALSSR